MIRRPSFLNRIEVPRSRFRVPRVALRVTATVATVATVAAAPLHAQKPTQASGRLLRVMAKDTVPVPGARVVLHRVGRAVQGPVDSTMSGPRGQFTFRFVPDTAAIYLLSSGWQGIEYFSTPLHTDPTAPDTGLMVVVSDTSSTVPITRGLPPPGRQQADPGWQPFGARDRGHRQHQ